MYGTFRDLFQRDKSLSFCYLMRTQHSVLDTLVCRWHFSQCLLGNLSIQVPVLLKQHAGKNLRGSRIFLFLPTYFLLFCKYGMSFWHRRAKSVTKTITLSSAKIHRLRHWHIDGKNNPKDFHFKQCIQSNVPAM